MPTRKRKSSKVTKRQIKTRAKASHQDPEPVVATTLPIASTVPSETGILPNSKFADLSREDLILLLLQTQEPVPISTNTSVSEPEPTILNSNQPVQDQSSTLILTGPATTQIEPQENLTTSLNINIDLSQIPTFEQHQLSKKGINPPLPKLSTRPSTANQAPTEVSSITPSQSISQAGRTDTLETDSVICRNRKDRTKAKNVPESYVEYFNFICGDLDIYCITQDPYPSGDDIQDVWSRGFISRGFVTLPLLKSVHLQIDLHITSFRGHIADTARKIVEREYELPFAQQARAERVRYLLEKNRFLSRKEFWDAAVPPPFSSPVIPQVLIRFYCNTTSGYWVKNPVRYLDINGVTICWVATVLWAALKRLETGTVDPGSNLRVLNGQFQYSLFLKFWSRRRIEYQNKMIEACLVPIKQKLDAYGALENQKTVVHIPVEDTQEGLDLEDALISQIEKDIGSEKTAAAPVQADVGSVQTEAESTQISEERDPNIDPAPFS